ncbi:hypothetical protein LCGC14_2290460, partial [marine sediment metagenome]
VKASSITFFEDFTTTTYQDLSNTNVTGWGNGNISLPSKTISYIGSYDTPGTAMDVYIDGDYAFITDGSSGLQVIDISDPANPGLLGTYDTTGSAEGIDIDGNYAYIADKGSGLQVINIANPTSPTLAGSVTYPNVDARDVKVENNIAFIADGSGDNFKTVNVVNPAAPVYIHWASGPLTATASSVIIADLYAFVADSGAGFTIYDIRDPTFGNEPTGGQYVAKYNTPGISWDIALAGNFAYIADGSSGLSVLDITNPTSPTLVGTCDTPGDAKGIALAGNFVYIADGSAGLQVIDISDPTNPVIVDSYDTPGTAYKVDVDGEHAFVADGTAGLQIIEVSRSRNRQFMPLGVAQSTTILSPNSASLVSVTLTSTDSVPINTNISYYISADNGLNWEYIVPGLEHNFMNTGNQLKWKSILENIT